MRNIKYISFMLILSIMCILFAGCPTTNRLSLPEQGVWYCKELNMQLSRAGYEQSYIVENNEKIICHFINIGRSGSVSVVVQHAAHPKYNLGQEIFYGKITASTDDMFKLVTKDNTAYIFHRIDKDYPADIIPSYNIKTAYDEDVEMKGYFKYPNLFAENNSYTSVNNLIKHEMYSQTKALCGPPSEENVVLLEYIKNLSNDYLLSLQFEGTVGATNNIAFCLNISIEDASVVSPTDYFTLDSAFVEAFLKQLNTQPPNCRFTEGEWEEILTYMGEFSEQEILKTLHSDPTHMLALEIDAITVLFPISPTAGDYIKVTVPYIWNME